MTDGREYELKLALPFDAAERVATHPALRPALPNRRSTRLLSTYYDTPDATLRRKRVSLRVRQSDLGTTQTLKSAGRSIVDRNEWERDGGGNSPDVTWLRSTPLKSMFKDDGVVSALDPQFTVDVSRTVFPIDLGGTTVEAALDQGAIRGKGLSIPVSELELELKNGSPKRVIELARELAQDLPLVLSLASKAERGYGIVDLSWGKPTKAIPVDLSAAKSLRDAFADIVQACLHTLTRNAALIGSSENDEEAVHKTRIALRHLRAAFQLFQPALRRKRLKTVDADVKWMSDKLGDARDADVFQHGRFDGTAERDDLPGASAVADMMRGMQKRAHRKLQTALASSRWRVLLLDLLVFSNDGVRRSLRERRCTPFLRRRLAHARERMAQSTRGWRELSETQMHDIRKQAKMLRYNLDLLETVPKLGGKPGKLRKLGEDLQTLQQTLGDVHDRVAMRERLDDMILRQPAPRDRSPEDWPVVQQAARQLASERGNDDENLSSAYEAARRLRRNEPFEV